MIIIVAVVCILVLVAVTEASIEICGITTSRFKFLNSVYEKIDSSTYPTYRSVNLQLSQVVADFKHGGSSGINGQPVYLVSNPPVYDIRFSQWDPHYRYGYLKCHPITTQSSCDIMLASGQPKGGNTANQPEVSASVRAYQATTTITTTSTTVKATTSTTTTTSTLATTTITTTSTTVKATTSTTTTTSTLATITTTTPPSCLMATLCTSCDIDGAESRIGTGYTLQQCKDSCLQNSSCLGIDFGKSSRAGECYHNSHQNSNYDTHSDFDAWAKTCQTTTALTQATFPCSIGGGSQCKTCKPVINRTANYHCETCNTGYRILGTSCQAYYCTTGGGTACKSCKPLAQRTTNDHCDTCNNGYNISSTMCQAYACSTDSCAACKSCKPLVQRTTNDHCDTCNHGYSISGTTCLQPTNSGATTLNVAAIEGLLVMAVSNATQFVHEPNISAVMRTAIAQLLNICVTWVVMAKVSLLLDRRLAPRLRQLGKFGINERSLSAYTFHLADGNVKVEFKIIVPPSGPSIVFVRTIMQQFDEVALQQASVTIDQILQSGVLRQPYNATIIRVTSVSDTESALAPMPAAEEDASTTQTIIIISIVVCSFFAVCFLMVTCRGVRKRLQKNTNKDMGAASTQTLAACSLQTLLVPPGTISGHDGRRLRELARATIDFNNFDVKSSVFLTYAVGSRSQDDAEVGPGMFYAAALTKKLHDSRIDCVSELILPPGVSRDVVPAQMGLASRSSAPRILLVLQTKALYECRHTLAEIYTAQRNDFAIFPLRCERDLPDEMQQWLHANSGDWHAVTMCAAVQAKYGKLNSTPSPPYTIVEHPTVLEDVVVDLRIRLRVDNEPRPSTLGRSSSHPPISVDCNEQHARSLSPTLSSSASDSISHGSSVRIGIDRDGASGRDAHDVTNAGSANTKRTEEHASASRCTSQHDKLKERTSGTFIVRGRKPNADGTREHFPDRVVATKKHEYEIANRFAQEAPTFATGNATDPKTQCASHCRAQERKGQKAIAASSGISDATFSPAAGRKRRQEREGQKANAVRIKSPDAMPSSSSGRKARDAAHCRSQAVEGQNADTACNKTPDTAPSSSSGRKARDAAHCRSQEYEGQKAIIVRSKPQDATPSSSSGRKAQDAAHYHPQECKGGKANATLLESKDASPACTVRDSHCRSPKRKGQNANVALCESQDAKPSSSSGHRFYGAQTCEGRNAKASRSKFRRRPDRHIPLDARSSMPVILESAHRANA